METPVQQEKIRLRSKLRKLAQGMSADAVVRSDRGIAETLLALDVWKRAKSVFIYISMGWEPQTRGLIQAALQAGKMVAVPRCMDGGVMEARVIDTLEGLREGRFGSLEPDAGHPLLPAEAIDLVVAPCVAADRQGYRLGHGGGYYDRYLPYVRGTVVCLCRGRLLQPVLPHEALDRPVDVVITECEVIARR